MHEVHLEEEEGRDWDRACPLLEKHLYKQVYRRLAHKVKRTANDCNQMSWIPEHGDPEPHPFKIR